jgi:hypothetical protein
VALALVLRGRLGGLDLARTLDASIRVLVAGALLVAVTLGVREALSGLSDSLVDQIVVVAAASVAGLTVYAAVVLATRVEEARQISALIRGQLARLR